MAAWGVKAHISKRAVMKLNNKDTTPFLSPLVKFNNKYYLCSPFGGLIPLKKMHA
jgi:hypothetical protein